MNLWVKILESIVTTSIDKVFFKTFIGSIVFSIAYTILKHFLTLFVHNFRAKERSVKGLAILGAVILGLISAFSPFGTAFLTSGNTFLVYLLTSLIFFALSIAFAFFIAPTISIHNKAAFEATLYASAIILVTSMVWLGVAGIFGSKNAGLLFRAALAQASIGAGFFALSWGFGLFAHSGFEEKQKEVQQEGNLTLFRNDESELEFHLRHWKTHAVWLALTTLLIYWLLNTFRIQDSELQASVGGIVGVNSGYVQKRTTSGHLS